MGYRLHGQVLVAEKKEELLSSAVDFGTIQLLFGLSESHSVKKASRLGLKTRNQVFADCTYQDDGSLTPRSHSNALIQDIKQAVEQALQMIHKKTVNNLSGKTIPVDAETICIHGDGKHAAQFAKAIYEVLTK